MGKFSLYSKISPRTSGILAARRGLLNLSSTAEALPHFRDRKNLDLLTRHKIFSEAEIVSRCDIMLEAYCKTLHIEALTMVDMARRQILPAVSAYVRGLSEAVAAKKAAAPAAPCRMEEDLIGRISGLCDTLYQRVGELEEALAGDSADQDMELRALYCRNTVFAAMERLREPADQLELLVGEDHWPFPSYGRLLFGV